MVLVSEFRAVLFDRDATLVVDVPYNGNPDRVEPMPHAIEAVRRARRAGLAIGVVSNQSGIGRGYLSTKQVEAVNARVDKTIGPFDVWCYCPHTDGDACDCRKPKPGLIVDACKALHVLPSEAVVIGDIGADITAAVRAGAAGILIPTPETLPEEVAAASLVAHDLLEAIEIVISSSTAERSPL